MEHSYQHKPVVWASLADLQHSYDWNELKPGEALRYFQYFSTSSSEKVRISRPEPSQCFACYQFEDCKFMETQTGLDFKKLVRIDNYLRSLGNVEVHQKADKGKQTKASLVNEAKRQVGDNPAMHSGLLKVLDFLNRVTDMPDHPLRLVSSRIMKQQVCMLCCLLVLAFAAF